MSKPWVIEIVGTSSYYVSDLPGGRTTDLRLARRFDVVEACVCRRRLVKTCYPKHLYALRIREVYGTGLGVEEESGDRIQMWASLHRITL